MRWLNVMVVDAVSAVVLKHVIQMVEMVMTMTTMMVVVMQMQMMMTIDHDSDH